MEVKNNLKKYTKAKNYISIYIQQTDLENLTFLYCRKISYLKGVEKCFFPLWVNTRGLEVH